MEPFEALMEAHRGAVERFVKFRLPATDADDVLQEVWLTAYQKRDDLRSPATAKAWLLSIARSRCTDHFRAKAKRMEIPLDALTESALSYGRQGVTVREVVRDTLDRLGGVERQVLYLYYFRGLPQAEIAERLNVPLGTVKSRLNRAKAQFREAYPYPPNERKGENEMTKLPNMMPDYTITRLEEAPFSVRHEELAGMMIVPKCGETLIFGMYDFPQKTLSGYYVMRATGEVEIHGIRGVEIQSAYYEQGKTVEESTIFAQLTEDFCRYLGGVHMDVQGVRKIVTFLDQDFADAYAIGKNNCGLPVVRVPHGQIVQTEEGLLAQLDDDVSDIVGRYSVRLGARVYDTIRVVDIELTKNGAMLCEYYLDQAGRTILWRRFNRDDWAIARYGRPWTEQLPDNGRLTVNGETYVHWYDCITDYIL
ncbi:MAG: RNA polymerase sigma factor [Clostridia bacterium]|nr:RNA polymerase sigma factor [Clostridia bacterium]